MTRSPLKVSWRLQGTSRLHGIISLNRRRQNSCILPLFNESFKTRSLNRIEWPNYTNLIAEKLIGKGMWVTEAWMRTPTRHVHEENEEKYKGPQPGFHAKTWINDLPHKNQSEHTWLRHSSTEHNTAPLGLVRKQFPSPWSDFNTSILLTEGSLNTLGCDFQVPSITQTHLAYITSGESQLTFTRPRRLRLQGWRISEACFSCSLIHASFLFGLMFNLEVWRDTRSSKISADFQQTTWLCRFVTMV
jgi:hypothetical protein